MVGGLLVGGWVGNVRVGGAAGWAGKRRQAGRAHEGLCARPPTHPPPHTHPTHTHTHLLLMHSWLVH